MHETQSIEQVSLEINKYISEGRLVLFCGAGISMPFPTCLPSFSQYQQAIITEMKKLLPETKQRMLENEINILLNKDQHEDWFPTEFFMQQIFNHWGSKAIRLTDIFDSQQLKFNENHKIIASLARSGKIPIILTTNFDRLIERQIGNETICIEGYAAIQNLTSSIKSRQNFDKPAVVKLHGSAGNDKNIIVTLNQEGRPNLHIRDLIVSLVENYVFLVLGYSGRDFDLMPIILGAAKKAQGIYWNFFPEKYAEERGTEEKLWEAFENRFHPIILDSTKLLWMLLPLADQHNFKPMLPNLNYSKK